MGATGWIYFTPYQTDAELALQTLRKEIFKTRKFGQANQVMTPETLSTMPPEVLKALENLREAEIASLGKSPEEFETMEELLEAAAESGTHTIIDILSTSDGPDFACAWPANPKDVEETYGGAQPTREEVEEKAGELIDKAELERWQAVYFVVYRDGKPSELCFEGISGD